MNENKTENTKDCKQCEYWELRYKRAYLRLFNRVSEAINANITAMLEDALLEAEDICTSDDDDGSDDS